MKLWPFAKAEDTFEDAELGTLDIAPLTSYNDLKIVLEEESDVTDLINPHLDRYMKDALPRQGFEDTLAELLPGHDPEYYPALAQTLINRAKMLEKLTLGKKLGALIYRITGPTDAATCEECQAILKREGDSSMYYIEDALRALAAPRRALVESDHTTDLVPPHHLGCRCSCEIVFPDLEQPTV